MSALWSVGYWQIWPPHWASLIPRLFTHGWCNLRANTSVRLYHAVLNVPKSFATVSLWMTWCPGTPVCVLADGIARTILHISRSSDIFSYKNVPRQKAQTLAVLWMAHGLSPLCRRIAAMFRALWRHQGVSTELGDQGTPFKELRVGIVDACMLSPTVGPWMAPGFHTKTWCHDAGCGLYWARAVRRKARLDLRSRAPTGR